MDDELRGMQDTGRKIMNISGKVFHYSGDFAQQTFRVFKLPGAVANKVRSRRENIMEKERYRQFKEEAKENKSAVKAEKTKQASEKNSDSIKDLLGSSEKKITNFIFTGEATDLCYFSQSNSMPVSAIANIPDEALKKSVIENFDSFIDGEYLKIDKGNICITDKGEKFINNLSFREQAKADQLQAYNSSVKKSFAQGLKEGETQMCAELTGNSINDFTVFNHTDTIDLKSVLKHPDRELSQKVLENVKRWEKKGAVTVSNGKATVTDMGKRMLSNPDFKAASKAIKEKAIDAVGNTNKVIVATKKAAAVPAKAVEAVKKSVKLKKP